MTNFIACIIITFLIFPIVIILFISIPIFILLYLLHAGDFGGNRVNTDQVKERKYKIGHGARITKKNRTKYFNNCVNKNRHYSTIPTKSGETNIPSTDVIT